MNRWIIKIRHGVHSFECLLPLRSYEDLLALTEAQARIAKLCHDPIGALEYVAGTTALTSIIISNYV